MAPGARGRGPAAPAPRANEETYRGTTTQVLAPTEDTAPKELEAQGGAAVTPASSVSKDKFRPDSSVVAELQKNSTEFGLFVIARTHQSSGWGAIGPFLTVLIRALAILLLISMWVLPISLLHFKVDAFSAQEQSKKFCPSTGDWHTRLLMASISVFYLAKIFMRALKSGFISNEIDDGYAQEWKFYSTRKSVNSQLRVWNAWDGFMFHAYEALVYSFNLWMLFIETDPVNMISNSLVMEFVMNFDTFFRDMYLWIAKYSVAHKVNVKVVDFTKYKLIDSRDIGTGAFYVYVVLSVSDWVTDFLSIIYCCFMLFYGPICKV